MRYGDENTNTNESTQERQAVEEEARRLRIAIVPEKSHRESSPRPVGDIVCGPWPYDVGADGLPVK